MLHSSHQENDVSQQQIIGQHMDTSELEAIAICYDNIRAMRRKIPNNNDYELGKQFDLALRSMMDRLSNELQRAKSGELKVRASILAKKDLMALLTDNCSHYLAKNDPSAKTVFDDIISQFNGMVNQACDCL
jgi:hypothetical protein